MSLLLLTDVYEYSYDAHTKIEEIFDEICAR